MGALADCAALESITLAGEGITIDYAAFDRCKRLTEIIGFEQVISLDEFCFSGCAALTALPVIQEGRTLVPFRAIFEALGAEVEWEPETQTVTATQDTITLRLKIGEPLLYKNAAPIPMDTAAALIQDRTFVPLRAVSEALDYLVTWEDSTKTAIISSKRE